jgi:ATP-binding cassette subfamily F protein uup
MFPPPFFAACRVAQLYAVTILAPTLHLHGTFTAMKATKPAKPRKLSFKEGQIDGVDAEIARIEGLFASPDFHRTHATQTRRLTADLAAAKENLAKLYARWEELEATKAGSEK